MLSQVTRFDTIYRNMKTGYATSWFGFLFKFTALSKLLNLEEPPTPREFFETYFSSWRWTRDWFRDCIFWEAALKDFDLLIDALTILKKEGLFNEHHLDAIINHSNLKDLVELLSILQKANFLNEDNFISIAAHRSPHNLTNVFRHLKEKDILTPDNWKLVLKHQDHDQAFYLSNVLGTLKDTNCLDKDNFEAVATSQHLSSFAYVFSMLKDTNCLDKDNFEAVVRHESPADLANKMRQLGREKSLDRNDFNSFFKASPKNDDADSRSSIIAGYGS